MKVVITQSDNFYKVGEEYTVSENIRWGCFIVENDRSLIRTSHAVEATPLNIAFLKQKFNDCQTEIARSYGN